MKRILFNKKLWLLVLLAAILSSCGKENVRIKGNGQLGNETRNVQAFEGVVLSSSYEVFIMQDSITEVTIEAETNLFPFIETFVSGTALIIRTAPNANLKPNDPILVYVKTPYLEYVDMDGSGMISTSQLVSDNLNLSIDGSGRIDAAGTFKRVYSFISGSGDIILAGQADIGELSISGSGNVDAYAIQFDTCYANISGSGNMYLRVIDLLDIRISGSGSIYYKGNPLVYTSISGSGSVIHVP